MFKRHTPDNPDGSEPGEDTQVGPAQMVPEAVPPPKTYIIRRYRADGQQISTKAHGHEVVTNAAGMGNVMRVMEYVLHPNIGPTARVVLGIFKPNDGWLEYEEILPEPVAVPEKSRLIIPDGTVQ